MIISNVDNIIMWVKASIESIKSNLNNYITLLQCSLEKDNTYN